MTWDDYAAQLIVTRLYPEGQPARIEIAHSQAPERILCESAGNPETTIPIALQLLHGEFLLGHIGAAH